MQVNLVVLQYFFFPMVIVRNYYTVLMGYNDVLTHLAASSAQSRSWDLPDRYAGGMRAQPVLVKHWGPRLLKIPLGLIWKDEAKYATGLCRGIPVKI